MAVIAPDQTAAVVLAGGFGTRIRHMLRDLPKPMAPVNGRPFLEWVVRWLAAQEIRQVVLSTGYLAEVVARHFESQPVPGVQVTCVPETTPLGTGGGFLNAVGQSGLRPTAWVLLNGDSLTFPELAQARAALKDDTLGGVIFGRDLPDASRYGTLLTGADGRLLCFAEKRPGRGVINSGIYLLRGRLLAQFGRERPLSLEQHVFPALVGAGVGLRVLTIDTPFLDIGTPETLPQADLFIQQNLARFQIERA
jgi:NDP-sugar pyrophosphorylase family protein